MDGPGGLELDGLLWHGCWRLPPFPAAAKEPLDTASNYTLPYALVIMTIALGLLVVLHGSSRREREKPEEYRSKETASGGVSGVLSLC